MLEFPWHAACAVDAETVELPGVSLKAPVVELTIGMMLLMSGSQSDAEALAAGNLAYERRFGYIYLICASGLSGEQMLEALHDRLTNDDEQERLVVMDELRKIAALRMSKAVAA